MTSECSPALPLTTTSMVVGIWSVSTPQSIDHSHIVLIIGDLNELGHLPEFANQISGRQILVNGPTRSDCLNQYYMRMVYYCEIISY